MSVSLTGLHNAIKDSLATHFAGRVETVEVYRAGLTDPINTPAVLLEMEDGSDDVDLGDDRTPLRCRFTAHCILSFQTQNVEMEVREFAVEALSLVRRNRWGLGDDIDLPEQVEIGPGQFKPGKDGFESWYVSWEQVVYLGESVWDSTGVTPTEIYVGIAPNTGPDGDYQQVS